MILLKITKDISVCVCVCAYDNLEEKFLNGLLIISHESNEF